MESQLNKYKKFIQDCSEIHTEHSELFEAINKAFVTCFENVSPDTSIVDSDEADMLSKILKVIDSKTDTNKTVLNRFYNKFIRMDKTKFNEPFSEIFNKIKGMLVNLEQGTSSADDILKYIKQFN